MLFKEKLVLSNCDSVRQLEYNELLKRFMTGMTFGNGVILTPNTIIDNADFSHILKRKNLIKYLNEEGAESLVIRGFNLHRDKTLLDYFDELPSSFIFSSFPGSPQKGQLTIYQVKQIVKRLNATQKVLNTVNYQVDSITLEPTSLRDEIQQRINSPEALQHYFSSSQQQSQFVESSHSLVSRSDWYSYADQFFASSGDGLRAQLFKSEVINPCYHSLFASKGEGFLQDDVKVLRHVPQKILDAGVLYRSLKNEMELINNAYHLFEVITTFGVVELSKILTDEALGFIEDKMTETVEQTVTRKNWFGMYPKMQKMIGLEVK